MHYTSRAHLTVLHRHGSHFVREYSQSLCLTVGIVGIVVLGLVLERQYDDIRFLWITASPFLLLLVGVCFTMIFQSVRYAWHMYLEEVSAETTRQKEQTLNNV